jgi:hypothetical protein
MLPRSDYTAEDRRERSEVNTTIKDDMGEAISPEHGVESRAGGAAAVIFIFCFFAAMDSISGRELS